MSLNQEKNPSKNSPEWVIPSADIAVEGVSRIFPGETRAAVDNVSFEVTAGDLVVLLGPSGCGKTTLLKMINRLYEPTSGNIRIGGVDITSLPVNQLRRQIGYVIQQVGLFPHMTIRKNISVVPRLLGWGQERIEQRTGELLDIIGLPHAYLERFPRQLSGGEQQRIGLARALAADPAILLMDEPFAAVDAINRQRLQGELLEIHNRLHKTTLFVTHDVEEAFRLADKILVMNKGSLVQYGTPVEIVTRPADTFIEELVGTRDVLRRLSLLNVHSVLQARQAAPPKPPAFSREITYRQEAPECVPPEADLRSALTLLLQSGQSALPVVSAGGETLGTLTFNDLRAALTASIQGNLDVVNAQQDKTR